jgi:hypothetical protein
MTRTLLLASTLLTSCATVQPREQPVSEVAAVVQRQLDAYNAHDLQSFVATYSDDVAVYRAPSTTPAISGKQELSEFYGNSRFNLPRLHAEVLHRSVVGNKVVDHERITGLRESPVEAIAVYLVEDGLIRTVWLFTAD